MDLSVVVVTLNGRDALADCLDALAAGAPEAELIVANGPSADGTTGMVRDREDVDRLLELADRNVNVARNAGAAEASGDAIAFVDERTTVDERWGSVVAEAVAESSVATGPVRHALPVGTETSRPRKERLGGRSITHFDGANVVFRRSVLGAADGFDEYLDGEGVSDLAHRLAGLDVPVEWCPELLADRLADEPAQVQLERPVDRYRNLAYVLAKNYGPNLDAIRHTLGPAVREGIGAFRDVLAGDAAPSDWVGDVVGATGGCLRGAADGFGARLRDRRPSRNPNGISSRTDRVVRRYDWT